MPESARQARWVRTHARLLRAAVDSLVEHGYGGTTMQRVQTRAGVSRGTLVHHFASMQDLLVAAIHHVADRQLAELESLLMAQPGSAGWESRLTLLTRFMSGPTFLAGLELWVAARTDEVLRAALASSEREFGRALRRVFLVGEPAGPTDQNDSATGPDRVDLEALLALLRGLAVTGILRERGGIEEQVLGRWARAVQDRRMPSPGAAMALG
ncbi:MAG: TetR/AcrR family transcriptional regulator [Actinomycetota bacterium]|nr:TetR/AcrR family transcriptional regulator [Actinomycetota bacterium]